MSDFHKKRAQILLDQHGKQRRVGVWLGVAATVVFCSCGLWAFTGRHLPLWMIIAWIVSGLWVFAWFSYHLGPSLSER